MIDIISFCEKLGSTSPIPGGGAAAALTLSLAAASAEKAARFSVTDTNGVDKYIKIFEEIRAIGINLSSEDQSAFSGWQEARKLPKDTDDEKKTRTEKINHFSRECSRVPFDICKYSLKLTETILEFSSHCSKHLISDAGVGAYLSYGAFESGRLNIEINKPYQKDQNLALDIKTFFDEKHQHYKKITDAVAEWCGNKLKE